MPKVSTEKQRCICIKPEPRVSNAMPGLIICDNCMEVISHSNEKKKEDKKPAQQKKEKKAEVNSAKIKRSDFSGVGIEINRGYNEDCLETIKKIKDGQLDYVFTSPPYNVGQGSFEKYKNFKDEKSQQEYLDWSISIIDSLLRSTNKHVFWNIQSLTDNRVAITELQHHYKYKLKEHFIWKKSSVAPASTKGVVNSAYEHIFCFSNQEPNLRRFKDANFHGTFSNVIEVFREKNIYADINKATFPIDLPRTFMQMFGSEGDLWYDPFGGTGTTARAAIVEKKNFIFSELDKESYELACEETSKFYKENILVIPFEQTKKSNKKVEQINLEL